MNKVIRCEAGAKWLLDPDKIYEMVSSVVDKGVNEVIVGYATRYLKGIRGNAQVRKFINGTETAVELRGL